MTPVNIDLEQQLIRTTERLTIREEIRGRVELLLAELGVPAEGAASR